MSEPMPHDVSVPGEIRTFAGHLLDVFDPDPAHIRLGDIARGLAMRPRYGAQLPFWFSVAEHSCLVLDVFRRRYPRATVKDQLAALLHDAPEAYIGDMPKPVKMKLPDLCELEATLSRAIFEKYSIVAIPETVDRIDKMIRHAERFYLYRRRIPDEAPEWTRSVVLEFWSWERAEAEFLRRFVELRGF